MQLLDILQTLFGEGGPQSSNRLAMAGQGPNGADRPGYMPAGPINARQPIDDTMSLSTQGSIGIGHGGGPGQVVEVNPGNGTATGGGSGIGGFIQKLIDPQAEARNVTVDWLQNTKGYSPKDAKIIAGNKPYLQQVLQDHYKSRQPSEYDQRAQAAQRYGLTDEQAREFALTGDIDKPDAPKRSVQTIYDHKGNEQKVWFDESSGSYQPIGAAKSGILTPEEEAQKLRLAQAGRSQINVGSGEGQYDKTMGEGYAKRYLETRDMSVNAGKGLNTVAVMRKAMAQPGFYSGTGANAVQFGKRLLTSLGVQGADGVSSMEQFNAMSKQAALDLMGGSLGSGFSNADRDFVTGQVANLGNTPEGNATLLDIQEKVLKRNQEIGKLANDYAKQHGGRIDAGFDEYLAQWSDTNPLFPKSDTGQTQQPWYRRDDAGPTRIRNQEKPQDRWRATNPDTGQAVEWNGSQWVPAQ